MSARTVAIIVAIALPLLVAPASATAASRSPTPRISGNPFSGSAMWIWRVRASNHGRVPSIIAQARRAHISTIIVKSGDGKTPWRQFTPRLVRQLRAGGLRVCAWHFFYGWWPDDEARVASRVKALGADCLVIDAESQIEGRYADAQRFITGLRRVVGAKYRVGLSSFPYADFHPALPYSVLLGPGGAQYNLPQMYWRILGTSVGRVYSRTYRLQRPYGRPIAPMGQLHGDPTASEIFSFRTTASSYGARGVSWWDWQLANGMDWRALGRSVTRARRASVDRSYTTLGLGDRSDLVVWAQQLLRGAHGTLAVDGVFNSSMQRTVSQFQSTHRLRPSGAIGTATWRALLRYPAARVHWSANARPGATASSAAKQSRGVARSAWIPSRHEFTEPAAGR